MSNAIPTKRQRIALTILLVIIVAGLLSAAAYRATPDQTSTSDFDDFWLTGRRFLETGELTEAYGVHNYLPFFMLFIAPFCLLPLKAACVAFNLVALIGLAASMRLIETWSVSDADPPAASNRFARMAAPIAMTSVYIWGSVIMGQMALYTLTMLVVAWNAVERRRDGLAGFWLALAISTKVYPAALILFFVLKRKWRLLGATTVWLAMMNILAVGLAIGFGGVWSAHKGYYERSVMGQSGLRLAVVPSDKMSYTNQSSALLVRRFTQPTDSGVDDDEGRPVYVNAMSWDETPVGFGPVRLARAKWLLLGIYAILGGSACWACRRPAQSLSAARLRREYAAFIVLSLLISPIVWSFYYALCLLPLALLTRDGLEDWRRGRRWTYGAFVACLWWLGLAAIAMPHLRMCGYHWFACLALYAALLTNKDNGPPINADRPANRQEEPIPASRATPSPQS